MKYRDDLPCSDGRLGVADPDRGAFPWWLVIVGFIFIATIIVLSPDYLNWIGMGS